MSSGKEREISFQDIDRVHSRVEWCLLDYMTKQEAMDILLVHNNIEPRFTQLVWERLEEENPEFFKAYYVRVVVKGQILKFNRLIAQQVEKMKEIYGINGATPMLPSNGFHHASTSQQVPSPCTAQNVRPLQEVNIMNIEHASVSDNCGSSFHSIQPAVQGTVNGSVHRSDFDVFFHQNRNMGLAQRMNGNMGMAQSMNGNMGMAHTMNRNTGMAQSMNDNMGMAQSMNRNMEMAHTMNGNMGMAQMMNGNMGMGNMGMAHTMNTGLAHRMNDTMGMAQSMNGNMEMAQRMNDNMGMAQSMNMDMEMAQTMNGNMGMAQMMNGSMEMAHTMNGNMRLAQRMNRNMGMAQPMNRNSGMGQTMNGNMGVGQTTNDHVGFTQTGNGNTVKTEPPCYAGSNRDSNEQRQNEVIMDDFADGFFNSSIPTDSNNFVNPQEDVEALDPAAPESQR